MSGSDATRSEPSGAAAAQGALWSAHAEAWARDHEPLQDPLYAAALDTLGVGPGSALLDVGAGGGRALLAAADRGATVTGLDAAPALAAYARSVLPGARIEVGDMEALPFGDGAFDAVTLFNALQFAARPSVAVAEARRVLRPGGRLLAAVWAPVDRSDAAGYMRAIGALLPPRPPDSPGPFTLSAPGTVAGLLAAGGLEPDLAAEVETRWRFADRDDALRALRAPGPTVAAVAHAGAEAVDAAILDAIAPFAQPDGSYLLRNVFVYDVGRKP